MAGRHPPAPESPQGQALHYLDVSTARVAWGARSRLLQNDRGDKAVSIAVDPIFATLAPRATFHAHLAASGRGGGEGPEGGWGARV